MNKSEFCLQGVSGFFKCFCALLKQRNKLGESDSPKVGKVRLSHKLFQPRRVLRVGEFFEMLVIKPVQLFDAKNRTSLVYAVEGKKFSQLIERIELELPAGVPSEQCEIVY